MALDALQVELTIVLGRAHIPLHRFLRMGRGAVIALDARDDDVVDVLANGLAVARGRIVVQGGAISVEIIDLVRKADITRTAGATIGGRIKTLPAPVESDLAA